MHAKTESYVLFELAGSTYAVPSRVILHIGMLEHVTLVPNAHPSIDGVVFSRGQVMPALNLRTRFGFPKVPHTIRTRLIFVQIQNRSVGLIVDGAREFKTISAEDICPIEETLTGIEGNYLQAVTKIGERLILLLDIEKTGDVSDSALPTPSQIAELIAKSKTPDPPASRSIPS
jgi:purine-binding chemotaxis protein CheW